MVEEIWREYFGKWFSTNSLTNERDRGNSEVEKDNVDGVL